MRRLLLPVAVLLAYLMVPGAAELTEHVVHWVQHGDGAHADTAGHEQGGGGGTDEHGCSDSYHLCLCHHGTGFVATAAPPIRFGPPAAERPATWWRLDAPSSIDLSDIFRPPIA